GVEHAPQARTHAIREQLFLTDVAQSRPDHRRHFANRFARGIAGFDRAFRALFEIERDRHGKPGAVWPLHDRRTSAGADEVARRSAHATSSSSIPCSSLHASAKSSISMASFGLWLL